MSLEGLGVVELRRLLVVKRDELKYWSGLGFRWLEDEIVNIEREIKVRGEKK